MNPCCRLLSAIAATTVTWLLPLAAHGQGSAAGAVELLLAADRRFAEGAGHAGVTEGLAPMFAADVAMQTPDGFVNGRDAVLAALRANPANGSGRLRWSPIRGGVSADGTHGFTFGYMTMERPDSATLPLKYMAYWVRGADGWRVAVYKRSPSAGGTPASRPHPPSLPAMWGRELPDAATAAQTMADAERAFSDLAGKVGLREAFRVTGAPDAVNMGGRSTSFVVGPDSIAALVSQGDPSGGSALTWASDRVIVAASGDLGISIGTIVAPRGTGAAPARIPFFTIWRRDAAGAPWRYIAE